MVERTKHFAIIPARAGSKSFPKKNQYFFNFTADFLESSGLFDGILVSSDDEVILNWAADRGHFCRQRDEPLASDSSHIRDAIVDLIDHAPHVHERDYLWLTYTTTIHKDLDDFRSVRRLVDEISPPAFCTFIPVATHPYIAWYQDKETHEMRQYIPNDAVNRQEFPPAWRNYHYVIGFRADVVECLNGNLLGAETYPIFLSEKQTRALCDLDSPSDIERWKLKHPEEFSRWQKTLPTELDRVPIAAFLDDN
jgi:CMP-N-acetylneuraminic acid synthetase